MVTQEKLKELFSYDGANLIRKKSVSSNTKRGDVAGCLHSTGYSVIRVDGYLYKAHRLIWLYVNGRLPEFIDHINGVRNDNRIQNMRNATKAENSRNVRIRKKSKLGLFGLSWVPSLNKFRAKIKKEHLGVFNNLFDAACARKSAEIKHGFHPNHGSKA